jgi:hypothetical protein
MAVYESGRIDISGIWCSPPKAAVKSLSGGDSGMDPGAHRPLEIVESCFAAIEAQDADRLAAHYTDDYVLELPYWKPEEPLVIEGREAAHAYLVTLLAVQHMRLEITTDRWTRHG